MADLDGGGRHEVVDEEGHGRATQVADVGQAVDRRADGHTQPPLPPP